MARGDKGRAGLDGERGSGRAPLLAVRITPELQERIEAAVIASGQGKAELVRQWLTEALDAMDHGLTVENEPTRAPEPPPVDKPAPQKRRRKKTSPDPPPSPQLALDIPREGDWREALFAAHKAVHRAHLASGGDMGSVVPIEDVARRLGWSVDEVRHRVKRARGEQWGSLHQPLPLLDATERVYITQPPTGDALRRAGASADLREWREATKDASLRLGISEARLDAIIKTMAPSGREAQELHLHANIPPDQWWTSERAFAALREAVSDPDRLQVMSEVMRPHLGGLDPSPAAIKRRAYQQKKPNRRRRRAIEVALGIPAAAWDA